MESLSKFFIGWLLLGLRFAPSLEIFAPPVTDPEELSEFSDLHPKFDFRLGNWLDRESDHRSILLTIFQSTDGMDNSGEESDRNENYELKTEPGTIILSRFRRGIKRKSPFKKRRVARHKQRSTNLTKQQLKSTFASGGFRSENNFNMGEKEIFASNFSLLIFCVRCLTKSFCAKTFTKRSLLQDKGGEIIPLNESAHGTVCSKY